MKIGKMEPLKLQGFKLGEKDGKKFIYAYLDETRLFYAENTGRVYCDLVMFETPNSEYSDYAVSESKKQDEEIELPIVGNFKNWSRPQENDETTAATAPTKPQPESDSPDSLPF
jgi:hypothetical protein